MNPELENLLADYLDGTISPTDENRLLEILRQDDEAARELACHLKLHWDMSFSLGKPASSEEDLLESIHGAWLASRSEEQFQNRIKESYRREIGDSRSDAKRKIKFPNWVPMALAACLTILAGGYFLFFAQGKQIATLQAAQPGVTLKRNHEVIHVRNTELLRAGDIVGVGQESSAVICYADGTRLDVGGDSSITLQPDGNSEGGNSGSEVRGQKSVRLQQGTLLATVAKQRQGRPMVFLTPNAVATVVGTRLQLSAKNESTRLEVQEGEVNLTRLSDRASVMVSTGTFAVVPPDGGKLVAQALEADPKDIASDSPESEIRKQVLFHESFEDSNFAARGWYDNSSITTTAAEHIPESSRAAEFHFPAGAMAPTSGGPMRKLFPETDSVFLSYWVKYSPNYFGLSHSGDIQEFLFLTNEDDRYSGLTSTHLSAAIEQNKGIPNLWLHDGANIDNSRFAQDLINITEERAIAGGNGVAKAEETSEVIFYKAGKKECRNGKSFLAGQVYFQNEKGPYYKGDWHHVEVFFKLNTISAGKGNSDGILRYWYDGRLIIERKNVIMRTGKHPNMKFNQFVIAPYISKGSPTNQTFWVDDLTVATERR